MFLLLENQGQESSMIDINHALEPGVVKGNAGDGDGLNVY
jgi:hypothetical protein